MPPTLTTERLVLRGWRVDDASAALQIYGSADVTRWLSPAIEQVPDLDAMRGILIDWIDENGRGDGPSGRWAMARRGDGRIVGGIALLPLPPRGDDLEIGWQLPPEMWGNGYATSPPPRSPTGRSSSDSRRSTPWSDPATPVRRGRAPQRNGMGR